jgi:hypothetical protein
VFLLYNVSVEIKKQKNMNRPKSSPETIRVETGSNPSVELTGKEREVLKNISSLLVGRSAHSQNVLFESEKSEVEAMKVSRKFEIQDHFRIVFHNKEAVDVMAELQEKIGDENTYGLFVKVYSNRLDFGVGVEKMMEEDAELRDSFTEIVDFDLKNGNLDAQSRKAFRGKARAFQSKLLKYSTKKSDLEDTVDLLEDIRRGRRLIKITNKLAQDPDFVNRKMELENRYYNGDISRDELIYETENLYNEKVAESDDDELKALWGSTVTEEKAGKELKSALDVTVGNTNATPVSSEQETVDAVTQVNVAFNDTNFAVNYLGRGIAKVRIAEFEADLRVFKDKNTKEFVYFLNDRYTHGQMVGPFDKTDLAEGVDSRRVDAYLTTKIGEIASSSSDLEGIKNLPDATVEKVGKKLIGAGGSRKFDILSNERGVLDKFAELLLKKDEKLVTVESKIKRLNSYLNSKARVDAFKTELTEGRVENISALA